jgi:hypothetical protein
LKLVQERAGNTLELVGIGNDSISILKSERHCRRLASMHCVENWLGVVVRGTRALKGMKVSCFTVLKNGLLGWVQVAHACNSSYSDQEAEIRKIMVWSQPGQIVCETLFQQYPVHTHIQKGSEVAQVVRAPAWHIDYEEERKTLLRREIFST